MERSEQINELSKALTGFQKDCPSIPMTATNPFFKSKYADLNTIMHTVTPVLAKHSLSLSQVIEGEGGVTTILSHVSGQFYSGTVHIEPSKKDPQGYGSAITYARRYAVLGILGLVGDPDDDGNTASKSNGKTKEAVLEAKEKKLVEALVEDETMASKPQITKIGGVLKKNNVSKEDAKAIARARYGKDSATALTRAEADDFITYIPKYLGEGLMPFDVEPFNKQEVAV